MRPHQIDITPMGVGGAKKRLRRKDGKGGRERRGGAGRGGVNNGIDVHSDVAGRRAREVVSV